MRKNLMICLALLLALASASAGHAQGVQTSTLIGTVTSNDGQPLPGVTVTVTSPALLGERATTSGVNGDYVLRGLPPGQYNVKFTLEGMQAVERSSTLALGGTSKADATMEVATASETIVVTGEAPSALETTTVGANFEKKTIDNLPITRTPTNIALLSAGLTENVALGRNSGQVAINGGMAYDNAILIDGTNVQDSIFGQTNNLYIQEAIEETQVLTSGISAEYGGFSGGVINTITKSGGNQFSGTFRVDLDKPDWRDETPYEKENGITRTGDMNKTYEATLGGPIVRDRLWFFVADREFKRDQANTTAVSSEPYVYTQSNPRYQVKLTGAITSNHNLQVSYINNDRKDKNNAQLRVIDTNSLIPDGQFPNDGTSVSYSGVFTNSLYGELRYSEKKFQFKGLGGSSQDIHDSPFYSYGFFGDYGLYNQPYFDATDPEDRNNKEYAGSLSYFLSTEKTGSHDMKFGVERFTTTRTGGNSQSSTNYVFVTDFVADASGNPVIGANGRLVPLFTPGFSILWNYIPTRGAQLDITTDSFFVNDRWNLNDHWSFNLGARYEKVRSTATGGIDTVDTDAIVPRLGASYDIKGDGKWKVDVTYADYAGRYNPSIFGRNSPVGNPTGIYSYYIGPAGQGLDFAPGFDFNNYVIYNAALPTINTSFEKGLSSPVTHEITASFGFQLPKGGYGKLTYVNRNTDNFIDNFVTLDNGTSEVVVNGVDYGAVDNVVYKNTNVPTRKYEGLQFQSQYNVTDNWMIAGNWTWQIKNDGTYEGEGGQSIGTSPFGVRPEIYPANRVNPDGHLLQYQAHKIRVWTNYNLDLGRGGTLGIGGVLRYDSPTTFSYSRSNTSPTPEMIAANPGYATLPRFTLYFGDRGAGEFNSVWSADLALNYQVPIWKTLAPWIKFQVNNMFNQDKLVTYSTSIAADPNSPKDAFGLPTGYTKNSTFGKGTSNANYLVPREYLISAGIRF